MMEREHMLYWERILARAVCDFCGEPWPCMSWRWMSAGWVSMNPYIPPRPDR